MTSRLEVRVALGLWNPSNILKESRCSFNKMRSSLAFITQTNDSSCMAFGGVLVNHVNDSFWIFSGQIAISDWRKWYEKMGYVKHAKQLCGISAGGNLQLKEESTCFVEVWTAQSYPKLGKAKWSRVIWWSQGQLFIQFISTVWQSDLHIQVVWFRYVILHGPLRSVLVFFF